ACTRAIFQSGGNTGNGSDCSRRDRSGRAGGISPLSGDLFPSPAEGCRRTLTPLGYRFGEMGARPKQPGFGEVAPTLVRAGFFSGIRLTRGGLGPKITTVGGAALLRSRRQIVEQVELPAGNSQEEVDRLPAGNAGPPEAGHILTHFLIANTNMC